MVADKDLVALVDVERAQYGIDARRRVVGEDVVAAAAAEQVGGQVRGLSQSRLQLAAHEPGGLAFDLPSQCFL